MNPFSSKEIESFGEIGEIKRLFTTLLNDFLKTKPKCLLVTSAMRGEGKTTIVAGLASAAASQKDLRVLALDLNWYRPALHTCFGLTPSFDVDAFKEKKDLTSQTQHSGLNRLDILTAAQSIHKEGRPKAEDANVGTEILKIARDNYDFIIVDSSSIFPINRYMIDPITLSTASDGVAMIVLTGGTPRQQVKRAQVLLDTAKANLIGVIANHWQNPIFKATPSFPKQKGH